MTVLNRTQAKALTRQQLRLVQTRLLSTWQTSAAIAQHCGLPARTVLARPDLSLADLRQLKAGDIFPVTINRSLPLIVGDRIVALGSFGEQDGRAAFQIEKLAQETGQ